MHIMYIARTHVYIPLHMYIFHCTCIYLTLALRRKLRRVKKEEDLYENKDIFPLFLFPEWIWFEIARKPEEKIKKKLGETDINTDEQDMNRD